ncbi:MAG: hypothetical protein ACREBS_04700 [Nitrososphaerales archaeon]
MQTIRTNSLPKRNSPSILLWPSCPGATGNRNAILLTAGGHRLHNSANQTAIAVVGGLDHLPKIVDYGMPAVYGLEAANTLATSMSRS